MTEQSPSAIGTVAEEAARLIEDMATMARSSHGRADASGPQAGEPAQKPYWPDAEAQAAGPAEDQAWGPAGEHAVDGYEAEDYDAPDHDAQNYDAQNFDAQDHDAQDYAAQDHESPASGPEASDDCCECSCSLCGAEHDDTPSTCRLCPVCKGIALLRSVRPETVDLLADLALSVAAGLRDVAKRSRASDHGPSARSKPWAPSHADRSSVQDISVDDETEG